MQKKQDIHRSALSRHELEPLPAGVGCYKGFGRSFVREDKSAIMTGLEEIARASDEEIKKSEGQKDYLQKALAETESNLKELLQGNEALSRELLQSGAIQ
jgi:prefoldin subunit 1